MQGEQPVETVPAKGISVDRKVSRETVGARHRHPGVVAKMVACNKGSDSAVDAPGKDVNTIETDLLLEECGCHLRGWTLHPITWNFHRREWDPRPSAIQTKML